LQVRQDDMMDKFNHEMGVIKNMLMQMAAGEVDGDYPGNMQGNVFYIIIHV